MGEGKGKGGDGQVLPGKEGKEMEGKLELSRRLARPGLISLSAICLAVSLGRHT